MTRVGEIVQSAMGYATMRTYLQLTCVHVKANRDMGFCNFKAGRGRDRSSLRAPDQAVWPISVLWVQ